MPLFDSSRVLRERKEDRHFIKVMCDLKKKKKNNINNREWICLAPTKKDVVEPRRLNVNGA